MNPVQIVARTSGRIPIAQATPTEIVEEIKKSGCELLTGKIDGTETKRELVDYLLLCKCPVLRKKFSGIK